VTVHQGANIIPELAQHWVAEMGYGLSAELFFRDDVYRIRYENFIVVPNEIIRRDSQKIPALGTEVYYVNRHDDVRFIHDYSQIQHKRGGSMPDQEGAGIWKIKLTIPEVEDLEFIAGDMLRLLNYHQVNLNAKRLSRENRCYLAINEFYKKELRNP
jgi:hypothetical protein